MGHDEHFLSRLDRVNRTETDFALALYRDHHTIRWVLNRARVPERADRIAIAIAEDESPPHIIVARDGGFVTCLARGMSTGGCPRVTRRELDRLINESRACRQRLAQHQEDNALLRLFQRLWKVGPRLAREDFLPIVEIAPLLENEFPRMWAQSIDALVARVPTMIQEHKRPYVERESVLRSFWTEFHFAQHAMVLSSLNEHWMETMATHSREKADALVSGLFTLGRSGLLSTATRISWVIGRLGPAIRDPILDLFNGPSLSERTCGFAGVTALSLGGDEVARRAVADQWARHTEPDKNTWVTTLRDAMLQHAAVAHTEPARFRQEGIVAARRRLVRLGGSSMEGEIPDGDPENVAPALLATEERGVLRGDADEFRALVLGAPHVVQGMSVEMLYPPRRLLDVMVPPWRPDDSYRLIGLVAGEEPKRRPVRSDTAIGRNDPCPCGAGKKYKKCCGA